MPPGGRRKGKAGKSYSNRTDLNTNRGPLAVTTAPSSIYGERIAQERSQKAVPLAPPPGPAGSTPPAPGGGASLPPPTPGPAPGSLGDPLRPTERPGEPLTSGIDMGDGPGSEALGPEDPDLVAFKDYLPTLELLASQPGATVAARNFVRRIRGAMPVDEVGPQFGERPTSG